MKGCRTEWTKLHQILKIDPDLGKLFGISRQKSNGTLDKVPFTAVPVAPCIQARWRG